MPPCALCPTEAKYKCPACLVRTCSLACTKRHKAETGCTGTKAQDTQMNISARDGEEPNVPAIQKNEGFDAVVPPSMGQVTIEKKDPNAAPPVAAGKVDFARLLAAEGVLKFAETADDNEFLKGIVRQGYYRGGWDEDRAVKAFKKALEGNDEQAIRWRKTVGEGFGWSTEETSQ